MVHVTTLAEDRTEGTQLFTAGQVISPGWRDVDWSLVAVDGIADGNALPHQRRYRSTPWFTASGRSANLVKVSFCRLRQAAKGCLESLVKFN